MRKVVYFILTSVCWVLFSIPKKTCFHSSGRPLLLGIVFDTRQGIHFPKYVAPPPNFT